MDHLNEETLKSLLENRMSQDAQAQVRHHVRTCLRCEQKLRAWRASFDTLSEEPPAPKPVGYSHQPGSGPTVLVPAKPIVLSRHSRWVIRSVLAVGVALFGLFVVDTIRQGRQPDSHPRHIAMGCRDAMSTDSYRRDHSHSKGHSYRRLLACTSRRSVGS